MYIKLIFHYTIKYTYVGKGKFNGNNHQHSPGQRTKLHEKLNACNIENKDQLGTYIFSKLSNEILILKKNFASIFREYLIVSIWYNSLFS